MKTGFYKKHLFILLVLLTCKTTFAQWSNVNPNGAVGRFRQSVFVIGDTAYMANGHTPGYTTDVMGYTQNSNTWVEEPTYPGGGGDQGYFFTINDTGYVGAGANPGYNTDSYSYTPASGWTSTGTPPGGTRIFGVGFSIGSKGYMGTGFNSSNASLADLWEYDSFTGAWSSKASLPVGRAGGVAFAVNGKGYIGLGYASNVGNQTVLNDMYQYDPVGNTWTTMAPMPPFGEAEPAYFVLCGKLIIASGLTVHTANVATSQTWMFDPSDGPTGKWYRLPDFPGTPGYSPQGFAMGDTGFVYGGDDLLTGGTALTQMWRYVPYLSLTASDTLICSGTQVTLTAAGGATYIWSTKSGNFDTTGSAVDDTTTSIVVSPTVTTTYYYTATGNPCLTSDSIVIKVSSYPGVVSVLPLNPAVCNGQTITLKASGGSTYQWVGTSNNTDTINVTPSKDTTYELVVGNGSCTKDTFISVTVNNAAPLIIEPQSPSICNGQGVTLSVPVSGSGYAWSPSAGLSTTSGNNVIANPSLNTTYTVTGIDSLGCSVSGTDMVTINNAPPLIVSPPSPAVECNGQGIVLTVPASGSEYTWSPATGLSATTGSSVTANPTADITYTVSGIDSLGCAVTATEVISIQFGPNKPTITVSVTGDTLISSATNGNQWYINGTPVNGAIDSIFVIKGLPAGDSVSVSVTNVANGCSTTSSLYLTGIAQLSINNDQLLIYPNPANGFINVTINPSVGGVKDWNLQLTDVLGRTIYTKQSLNYKNEIDLTGLPGGIYFITVINKTGRVVAPVVKQN